MPDNKEKKPLCRFNKGELVKVEDLDGCPRAKSRLYAMGLTPGSVLEVVSSGLGPCRLKVRGSDVVLGRGLAHKIIACAMGECDQCPGEG